MLQGFCLCGWLARWATRRPRSHNDSHEHRFLSQGHKTEMKCTAFGSVVHILFSVSVWAFLLVCLPLHIFLSLCVCVSPSFSTHSSTILSTLPPRAGHKTDIYFNRHTYHAAGDGGTHLPFRIMSFVGQGGCISVDITFRAPPPPPFWGRERRKRSESTFLCCLSSTYPSPCPT